MSQKDKTLILEHVFDGRELNIDYAEATLKYIYELWGHTVTLKTTQLGKEIRLVCEDNKIVVKNNNVILQQNRITSIYSCGL